jgi:mannose-6-phosphate isomerase-like protein (cupin superfamily)
MRPEETIEAPTMGHRITCLSDTVSTGGELLRFSFWMRGDASPPPLHVHLRQEERIEVVSGSVLSISGGVRRVLGPGGTISTPPGEPHTVGPARGGAVEMIVEFRPSLGFERFVERTFALDRAGHVSAKGRGSPLRLAAARPHEAEFFLPGVPIGLQRAICALWTGSASGSLARAADDGRQ